MRGESEASQEDCPDQRRHSHSCSTEQLDCSWKRYIRTLTAHDQHKYKLYVPWNVQYAPSMTMPELTHLVLNICPTDCRISAMNSMSCKRLASIMGTRTNPKYEPGRDQLVTVSTATSLDVS